MEAEHQQQLTAEQRRGAVVLAILLSVGFYFAFEWWVGSRVVADATERFAIVDRTGDKRAACFQAESVAAAHLHVKHEAEYREWKAKAADLCAPFR